MEQLTVVGINYVHSKKNNKDYTMLYCLKDFDDFAKESDGQMTETLFLTGKLTDIVVGSVVEPVYTKGFNGQAVCSSVNIID